MRKKLPLFLLTSLMALPVLPVVADVPVIPRPNKEGENLFGKPVKEGFIVTSLTEIKADASLATEAEMLKGSLSGMGGTGRVFGTIELSVDSSLPKEGYSLKVESKLVTIKGGSSAGVFYGIQTFRQLLPPGTFKKGYSYTGKDHYIIPALSIEDAPAFEWRGVMLDTARHFRTKEFIKKFIDLLSIHKLNRLHWHLVDSEGWRLEIKKYPKLVEVANEFPAAYPGEDPTDKTRPARFMYGHFHGGGYYTQEDVKEIVAYAKARHIEVMPEIEFPGHMMAALTAYPEFGTTGKVPTVRSNISPDLINVNEKSIGFLKDILDETMELFPFEVIHFGGDESPKGQWKDSPEVQAKIKELGFEGQDKEGQLQAWLFNEMTSYIEKKGRRPAGWEEIMHGKNIETLDKKAIIWGWLSGQNAIKSANSGLGVVHVQTGPFYFDSWQTNSPAENWALYRGPFTLRSVYNFNMLPDGLTEEGKKNIYGAQAQLWAELMTDGRNVEYQGFPRICALAELNWTNQERKDYDDFYKRLVNHAKRLDALDVQYRYVDPLPSAQWSNELLKNSTFDVDVTIPATTLKGSPGEFADAVADFVYTGGNARLEIEKAELVIGGKVVGSDEHKGAAGSNSQDTSYKFNINRTQIPASVKPVTVSDVFGGTSAVYPAKLRVTHSNKGGALDSKGDIIFYTGKGVELYNPRNFAGGDYPSASWTSGEYAQGVANVRIPMDGIVLKDGDYELVFQVKAEKSENVVFGDVKVQGTDGTGSSSKDLVKVPAGVKTVFLPFTIKPSDVKRGNSIMFKVKANPPVPGEVRVRLMKTLPSVSGNVYAWNPQVFEGGRVATYIKGISPAKDGNMKIEFRYKGGGCGLDIKGVQIVKNGVVVAESSQEGFAGNAPKNNVYTIDSQALKASEKYDVRLVISGSGGNDTNGEITVE